ncbi:MAG TPA: transglycosylase SLT domain-containing protein [Acetobacteraceae bacterium]|nr:transglycosylase SLT domain-containing protein [Acetobacteraceae bacterium]
MLPPRPDSPPHVRRARTAALSLGFALAAAGSVVAQPAQPDPSALCRAAIGQVEREADLPSRLMQAISRVESGRRAEDGSTQAWPWTINAEGRGRFFPTKAAAIAAVQALQTQGVRSIDVGCMQVNLRHHPNAFTSLDEAFDPVANARYAARFLTELRSRTPDWETAAGFYHSQTPDLASSYRARVMAAWQAEQRTPDAPAMAALTPQPLPRNPGGIGGGAFMLSNNADRVQVLPPAADRPGRGLDAYRSAPIPIAGRGPAPAPATPAVTQPGSRRFFW